MGSNQPKGKRISADGLAGRFVAEWVNGPVIPFYISLVLYLSSILVSNILWDFFWNDFQDFFVYLSGAAAASCYIIILHRMSRSPWMYLVYAAGSIIMLRFASILVPASLILMAAGKDFRNIPKAYLFVILFWTAVAGLGQLFHYCAPYVADDYLKTEAYGFCMSFGYRHPNIFAQYILAACLCVWYLWLQRERALTFLLFWLSAVFVWFLMKSRTGFIMLAGFPFLALLLLFAADRDRKPSEHPVRKKIWYGFLIGLPFILLAFSLVMAVHMDGLVRQFKDSVLWNFFSRFVAGGVALKLYGIHLFGSEIDFSGDTGMWFGPILIVLTCLDNAYLSALVKRGVIAALVKLGGLSLINVKCSRDRNYSLLLISVFLQLGAVMETYPVNFSCNFAFLYLLCTPVLCQPPAKADYIPLRQAIKDSRKSQKAI